MKDFPIGNILVTIEGKNKSYGLPPEGLVTVVEKGKIMIKHVTEKSFDDDVLKSPVPVLVDFWASWCGPCRMQGGILDTFVSQIDDSQAVIAKVNVDEEQSLAARFGVMSIPTLIVFKNGEAVQTAVGVKREEELKKMLGL